MEERRPWAPVGTCASGRLADECPCHPDMDMARTRWFLEGTAAGLSARPVGLSSASGRSATGPAHSSPFIVATRMVAALAPHAWIVAGERAFPVPERTCGASENRLRHCRWLNFIPELVSSLEAGQVTGRWKEAPHWGRLGLWRPIVREWRMGRKKGQYRRTGQPWNKACSNSGRVASGEPGPTSGGSSETDQVERRIERMTKWA